MTFARYAILLAALLLPAAPAHAASTTVREPAFGLPHIFADTDLELARENGRQIARDRLAQMILLARVGRGTLYQAFGLLDPTTLNGDIEARRDGYTSSELNNMYAKLPQSQRDQLLEYCKGVNDVIDQIYAGTLPQPIEVNLVRTTLGLPLDLFGNRNNLSDQVDPFYAAPGGAYPNSGFQFTPEMFVAIAVLEVRNFGLGGFDEASLFAELQALVTKHGATAGTQIWNDRNFLVDPLAPVTVPDPTTPGYSGPLASGASLTAIASLAGHFPRYDYAAGMQSLAEARAARAEFAKRLGAWPMMGSYAWAIAGSKSATGYPWLGGFPQTGIQTPSIMHFAENRSAEGSSNRIRGLGMEFAGAPLVLIGQTDTVAYTSTTAQLRVVDTFFEHIVNEDSDVLHYNDEGTSAPLATRTETFLGGLAPNATRVFFRSHVRGANGGSRPVVDFVGDTVCLPRPCTVDSATATTLVDAGKFDASFVGGHVAIVDRTGIGQIRSITAVPDANTLQVGTPWTTVPTNPSGYVAVKAGNEVLAVSVDSLTWLEESTTAFGFGLMQRADTILDIRAATRLMPSTHNFPAADNLAWNGIGTQSGNGNIGYWSSGFSRKRQGGLDSRLPMDGSSPTNPLVVASGTVGSASATGLSAIGGPFTGKNFSPPGYNFRYLNPTQPGSEFVVAITTGTGYKQTRRIAANTASDLTIEYPWGVIPAAGDTFDVAEIVAQPEAINPSEGYFANWNNKAATADEGDNFGRQFRHIDILERLRNENAWDRAKQRQLNKDLAGLDGRGRYGRFLIPRLREAVDRVGNGGNPAVDTVLAALEAHNAPPFLGRFFIDPVTATTNKGELSFLNSLVNRLSLDIYGDEYAGAVGVPTGSRALNLVQHAIDSKEGDLPGAYQQAYAGDYFATLEHFMCYRTINTLGTPRFTSLSVNLADQFGTGSYRVRKRDSLCPPASKNGEVRFDAVSHLQAYGISGPNTRQTNIQVKDQFGEQRVDTLRPDRLLVPTGKALGGLVSPPTSTLDHFKCYRIRNTRGTPKFRPGTEVDVADQFETRRYRLTRLARLCNPVDKDGSGINHPDSHLVCYRAKVSRGQAPAVKIAGQIHTNNQFGPDQRVDTVKEEEICVPALKSSVAVQGWEVTVRNSLSTLATGGIPADSPRGNSTYRHPLAALFPVLVFQPTPFGNRGTYEQIVDVGPVVNGEFMFPLGQSGHIEGSIAGVTLIDANVTSLQPIWRDWRFVPILHVGQDLVGGGNGDTDGDGVLDAYERWYFGDLSHGAADDSDGDGATLLQEYTKGSDPTDPDTDDDGILDGADSKPQDRLLP